MNRLIERTLLCQEGGHDVDQNILDEIISHGTVDQLKRYVRYCKIPIYHCLLIVDLQRHNMYDYLRYAETISMTFTDFRTPGICEVFHRLTILGKILPDAVYPDIQKNISQQMDIISKFVSIKGAAGIVREYLIMSPIKS